MGDQRIRFFAQFAEPAVEHLNARAPGEIGNVCPLALANDDDALVLQLAVGPSYGVGCDAELRGQLTYRG
jgi:hypothetical protein